MQDQEQGTGSRQAGCEGLQARVAELEAALEREARVRQALERDRELLQALMDSLPEQIYFKDTFGRFMRVNRRQAAALGLNDPEQAVGRTDFDFYVAEIVEGAQADEQRIIATGVPLRDKDEKQTLKTESGAEDVRWFSTTKAPIIGDDGAVRGIVGVTRDITERKRVEEELRQGAVREELMLAQQAMLDQLSTPLIPIGGGTVLMPLIGAIDTQRAERMLESLLHGIEEQRAGIAILDITGVPLVDTQVASVLIQSALAARLLGAQVVLTGIRPEVAQTLIGLGVDLSAITTRASLEDGVAYALGRR